MDRRARSLAVVAALLVTFMTFRAIEKGIEFDNDASAYLGAAQRVLSGEGLYQADTRPGVHEYAYPPTLALLLVPIAALGDQVAVILWSLLSITAWLVSCHLIVRVLAPPAPVWRWTLTVAPSLLLVRLIDSNFGNGQANSLILLGFALALHALHHRRGGLAGTAIGFGAACKLTPIGFLAYFVVTRNDRALFSALTAVIILLVLLPVAALGPAATTEAYTTLSEDLLPVYGGVGRHDVTHDGGYVAGQSLRPMIFRYLTPSLAGKRTGSDVQVNLLSLPSAVAELIYLAMAVGIALLGLRGWIRGPRSALTAVSIAVIVMLLASPYARKASFILLLIPCTLLLDSLRGMERTPLLRIVWTALGFFAALVLAVHLFGVSPPIAPLVVLACALGWSLRLRGSERRAFALCLGSALCTLTAPGLLGGYLANQLLALSAVTLGTLFLALALASHIRDESVSE